MKTALGIDIGGTATKLAVLQPDGTIIQRDKIPTEARGIDPAPFFTRLFAAADGLVEPYRESLVGIGISAHGEVDRERRRPIIAGNTPALRNVDVRGALEARYGLPVVMNNDLTAHALGEYYFGCGNGIERFMCLAMGTGLGAALIVEGKPLIIDGGNSGNTGLIILDPAAPRDSNGIRGSAEGLIGVPGIERLAQERYGHPVPAHEVIAAAREQRDPTAVAIMTQVGTWTGQTLASLSVIFYPHRIALTGGTASAGAVLLDACRAEFDRLVGDFFRDLAANTGGNFRNVEIVLGEGGADTGALGAAVELFQQAGLLT
ncbi:MAG: ROK family protein [Chloroflexi bacterium]|uniref:ROK family protein n=1 Tax=Candidatus Flexifilum breve TaxID=3140694 RepID=UPI003134F59D|nr:ROK family protein [Chloroflexota bacterium]